MEAGARNFAESSLPFLDRHHTIAVLIDFICHQYYRNIEISVLKNGVTISVKIEMMHSRSVTL